MTADLTLLSLFAIAFSVILLMFLPAFLELKRPLDAGPRWIIDNFSRALSCINLSIVNIEDSPQAYTQSVGKVDFLEFMPNLEA